MISIAIALYLGWEKPYWAAFAVVMISLDTNGQSLNKGAMRMLGTVIAVVAAFTFLALFPQQRWAMLAVLIVYVGFCTYMLAGTWRQYAFFVAGFVCVRIIVEGAPDSANAFATAVARLQETALGILVYTLIGMLLWPSSSRKDLEASAKKLHEAQVDLYRGALAAFEGKATKGTLQPVRIEQIQSLGQFEANLEAALLDSYEVWEMRRRWRQYQELSRSLMQTLEHWSATFAECQHLDLSRLLPNFDAVIAELDRRGEETGRLLDGVAAEAPLSVLELEVDLPAMRALAHVDRAAAATFKGQLDRLETLSRDLFYCVEDIKGLGSQSATVSPLPSLHKGFGLDLDRLHATVTVAASMTVGYFVWIFVDPPMHSTFFFQTALWAMLVAMIRQSAVTILPGILLGSLVAALVYVFVMPHLSGYAELGTMLFVVVFVLFWLLFAPQNRGSRAASLATFLVLISLENSQSYDFARLSNSVGGTLLSLGLVILIQYFPFSPRPEKVFLRLVGRFFRHLEFLLTRLSLDWERERGGLGLLRTLLYRSDILRIPVRLTALVPQIDYRVLPGTTPEQARDLAASMQAVAFRINELLDTRESDRANPLVLELLEDLRAWRLAVRDVVRHWAEDPGASPPGDLGQRLAARIEAMESRITEVREGLDPTALDQRQYEGFYRVVGAFRSLSEAGVTYANLSARIDWRPWKEARF